MCFSLFPAFFLPSCLSLSNDWSCHVQFPSALFVLPVCFPTYSNASGLHRATGPCRSKGTGDLLEAPQPLPLDNGPGTSAATRGRPRPPGLARPGPGHGRTRAASPFCTPPPSREGPGSSGRFSPAPSLSPACPLCRAGTHHPPSHGTLSLDGATHPGGGGLSSRRVT